MNIREHIEAGHYPVDDKGRAMVPTAKGHTFVCCATDKPGPCPLVGWIDDINHAVGQYADSSDFLPPPPRKVKRWAALTHEQLDALRMYASDGPAQAEVEPSRMLVSIEYEVPWS